MSGRWGGFVFGLLCWCAVAQGITQTTIQDTLYNADGTAASGLITVSWRGFTATDGTTVAGNSLTLRVVNGVLKVSLVPNPFGTSYTAIYLLNGKTAYTETWVVPESVTPLKLGQVQVAGPVAPGGGNGGSGSIANIYVSRPSTGVGPTAFTPSATWEVYNAGASGVTRQVLRNGSGQGTTPLLEFHPDTGSNAVGFRVPPLSSSTTYTLPAQDGLPGTFLRTDGTGNLTWAAGQGATGGVFYQTFQNGGTALTQRDNANFASGLEAVDDAVNDRTTVSPVYGNTANTVTQGNDPRLSDARTPVAHASTHASNGSDPITPGSIGALKNSNDVMTTGAASNIGLVVKGAPGQAASLQEWRDSSDNLLASITSTGRVFFPEAFFSAPPGQTATSLFFQVDGLSRFSMTTFSTAYNFNRYDDLGNYKDTPFQIARTGDVQVNDSLDVQDTTAATGATRVMVRAGQGQGTTNLTEWRDNAGTLLASVDPSGFFQFPAGQKHGSGTQVQVFSGGAPNPSDCAMFDSNGNLVSAGGGCGSVHVPVFQDGETPAGTINGSNAAFTLAFAPSPASSLELTRNGVVQKAGQDFNLAGNAVTFTSGAIPQTGDMLLAWYRVGTSAPSSAAGGDLSGSYPNPTVATVGGAAAASVASGANAANAATSANTASTIVKRDASGNFSAGTVTLAGNLQLGTNAVATQYTNEGTSGTTVNRLAKLTGSPSTAVVASTADASGAIGVVVGGAGTTGSAQVATRGQVLCDFDGATTAGHYVGISATTAGKCRDAGASFPASGQVLGRVLSTNAGAGTYAMQLFGPEVQGQVPAAVTPTPNATPQADSTGRLMPGWNPLLISAVNQGYFFGITIQAPETSGGTSTFSPNEVRVWQFVLPFPVTVNQITFEVVAASGTGKSVGLGLWDGSCSNLVLNSGVMTAGGNPDINTTGIKSKAIASGPVTLNAGTYWLAMTTDSTTLTLRSFALPSTAINLLNNGATKLFADAGNSGSAGSFPAGCGGTTVAISNQPPMVLFQR